MQGPAPGAGEQVQVREVQRWVPPHGKPATRQCPPRTAKVLSSVHSTTSVEGNRSIKPRRPQVGGEGDKRMRGGLTSHTRVQPVQTAPHRGTHVYTLHAG